MGSVVGRGRARVHGCGPEVECVERGEVRQGRSQARRARGIDGIHTAGDGVKRDPSPLSYSLHPLRCYDDWHRSSVFIERGECLQSSVVYIISYVCVCVCRPIGVCSQHSEVQSKERESGSIPIVLCVWTAHTQHSHVVGLQNALIILMWSQHSHVVGEHFV